MFVDQVEKPYAAAIMHSSTDEVGALYMVPPQTKKPVFTSPSEEARCKEVRGESTSEEETA